MKQKLKETAQRKDIKKKEKATMKEGKLILGQLGDLLKSRMNEEDHDHHHHHHSTDQEAGDGMSSAESAPVTALNSLKKHHHEPIVQEKSKATQLIDLMSKMNS